MEGTTVIGLDAIQPVLEALTGQISVANVVAVLAGVLGISIGFVFMYWAVRKGITALMGAFRKGSLNA